MLSRSPICLLPLTAFALLSHLGALVGSDAWGQSDRADALQKEPLAKVDVQALYEPNEEAYDGTNPLVMYRPEQEDPLSFYSRTQDGEWRIPAEVNADDPWVRLLMLGPGQPTIIDVAIELNQQPYRAAREGWIDRLLAEAKATFLVRAGSATADAVGINHVESTDTDEKTAAAEGTTAAVAASEDSAEAPNDVPPESDAAVPMVKVQRRQASTLFKRLINYLAADQSTAEREEVRWLLAEWTGGPALLTLSPAFAWRRAEDTPLWNALDRDGDQTLSNSCRDRPILADASASRHQPRRYRQPE